MPFGVRFARRSRVAFRAFPRRHLQMGTGIFAQALPIEPGVEVAEVSRFRLTRRERHVRLDVAVDTRKYREMLNVWTRRDVWDWGGD